MTQTDLDATPPMPAVGEMAPDFTLPDDSGKPRRLSDERGHWVVLYFYPADDTPGCTKEACQFRDSDAAYRQVGATVLGVSADDTDSKARFKAKYDLPFTLLADEDHAVSTTYGTWQLKNNYGRTYWGIQRATVLIDPEGRVARVWPRVKADGHADEVLNLLREIQAGAAAS
jgi:peroxiredoxin Q/BCP